MEERPGDRRSGNARLRGLHGARWARGCWPGPGWTARAPLLGILTYLAAGWSVLAAMGLVGVTLAVHATALGGA